MYSPIMENDEGLVQYGCRSSLPRKTHVDNLLARLIEVLQDKTLYQRVLERRPSDATRRLLDSFQHLLDQPQLESGLRKQLIVAIQRLASQSGLYPSCYELKDILDISDEPVATGGFADIYKGNLEGRLVCIKVIRLYQKRQIDHAIKKFSKEAMLWGQLSHPNILTIFGIFKFKGLASIVSQWMENGDITLYLNNKPSAPRLPLSVDVCRGLSYLHENSVIHGDLKGSNILIDDAGRARLADFGISAVSDPKIIAWTSQSSSFSEGGTVRWQAPELFDVEADIAGARNTVASDIYSWGCVCYEIFTGEIPFAHISNDYTVVVAVKSGSQPMRPEASSPSWRLWGLTEEIWTCMKHCWSSLPSDRPSAAAIIEHLSRDLPIDRRQKMGNRTFSPADFRSRMSKTNDLITVKYLDHLLGDSRHSMKYGLAYNPDTIINCQTPAIENTSAFSDLSTSVTGTSSQIPTSLLLTDNITGVESTAAATALAALSYHNTLSVNDEDDDEGYSSDSSSGSSSASTDPPLTPRAPNSDLPWSDASEIYSYDLDTDLLTIPLFDADGPAQGSALSSPVEHTHEKPVQSLFPAVRNGLHTSTRESQERHDLFPSIDSSSTFLSSCPKDLSLRRPSVLKTSKGDAPRQPTFILNDLDDDDESLAGYGSTTADRIQYKLDQNAIAAEQHRRRRLEYRQSLEIQRLTKELNVWKTRATMCQNMLIQSGLNLPAFSNLNENLP